MRGSDAPMTWASRALAKTKSSLPSKSKIDHELVGVFRRQRRQLLQDFLDLALFGETQLAQLVVHARTIASGSMNSVAPEPD